MIGKKRGVLPLTAYLLDMIGSRVQSDEEQTVSAIVPTTLSAKADQRYKHLLPSA